MFGTYSFPKNSKFALLRLLDRDFHCSSSKKIKTKVSSLGPGQLSSLRSSTTTTDVSPGTDTASSTGQYDHDGGFMSAWDSGQRSRFVTATLVARTQECRGTSSDDSIGIYFSPYFGASCDVLVSFHRSATPAAPRLSLGLLGR